MERESTGNCQPRLPAVQFQVKRDSPNRGRWFYTCQIDRTKGKTGEPAKCDFFLWAEEARLREEGSMRSDPAEPHTPGDTPGTGRKSSLRTPRRLVQTTLSATVTPREEGPRHWTHRTPVTSIADLERQVNGTEEGQDDNRRATTTATASSSRAARPTATLDHDYGLNSDDCDTEEEAELSRAVDQAVASSPSSSRPGTALQRYSPRSSQQLINTPSGGSKRKRPIFEEAEKEKDLFGPSDSDEDRQLAALTWDEPPPTPSSSRRNQPGRNSQQSKNGGNIKAAPITPAARRTDVVAGLPTPSLTGKSVRRVLFAEPEASVVAAGRKEYDDDDDDGDDEDGDDDRNTRSPFFSSSSPQSKRQRVDESGSYAAAPSTPNNHTTSNRNHQSPPAASPTPSPNSSPGAMNHDATGDEVLALLAAAPRPAVPPPVLAKVRAALARGADRARGLERGRDASRLAARRAHERVAGLQARIADLESQLRRERAERLRVAAGLRDLALSQG